MSAADLYRGQSVCHGNITVIVSVDSEVGGVLLFDAAHNLHYIVGQTAPICVTQHKTIGTALCRSREYL